MKKETRTPRTYDHRLRQLVHSTGNIQLAIELGVPRSTARGVRETPEWPLGKHRTGCSISREYAAALGRAVEEPG